MKIYSQRTLKIIASVKKLLFVDFIIAGIKIIPIFALYLSKKDMMYLNVLLGMVGPWQIVIIVALALLFFGGKKIPELMKGLGQGVKEFKKATKDFDEEVGRANPQKELESKSE